MAKVKRKSNKLTPKRSKYGAQKIEIDGITFDSTKEGKRYVDLKHREEIGLISNLRRQVSYELIPAIYTQETIHLKTKDKVVERCLQKAVTYIADFVYILPDGTEVVEDVKGSKRMITPDFKLKEKMMFALKGIRISVYI